MRILLIEDDEMIATVVVESLKDFGYAVGWVKDGKQAERAWLDLVYDMVLLDLGLPQQDGLQVLNKVRQARNDTPVIIITARDDIQSRLAGLDGGADDYLIKPFDLAELQARMRAILRRHHQQTQPNPTNGELTLDPQTYQVYLHQQNETISLTNKEFLILQALVLRAGKIFSRAELEDKLYGWGEEVESNAVDFLIYGLRKKIGKQHIKNVRGVGWLVNKAQGENR